MKILNMFMIIILFVKNTQFGRDMFDADYNLKLAGMGLEGSGLNGSGLQGLSSYMEMVLDELKNKSDLETEMKTSFWIYPVLSGVKVSGESTIIESSDFTVQVKVAGFKQK